jgi:Mu-like prophage major head subunit gpT
LSTTTISDPTLSEAGTWVATDANPVTANQIYAGDGTSIASGRARRDHNPIYREAFSRTLDLVDQVMSGNAYAALQFKEAMTSGRVPGLREAMTTSDFPLMFGDVLDRMVYASYLQTPIRWDRVARRGTVRDFRSVKRYAIDGAESALPEVDELEEYPAASLAETPYTYKVTKRGRRIPMSWETWLGGDLGQFQDLPTRLANAARRTEEKFVTSLYVGATGPNSTFFSAGNKNIVTANAPLSITGLQTAFTVLGNQVDAGGEPIYIEGVTLVVPRALEVVARNILNATEIWAATGGGNGVQNDQVRAVNWMRDRVELVVDPWAPIVATTNGATSWYLIANPSVGRPAMEIGFLIGHEQPEIWMKSADAVRVGGGGVDPEQGSFDNDSVQWRVRHVLGGVLVDPKMAVASNGTGS